MNLRMRSSADQRAPGIYQTFDKVAPPPLTISNTRITGFVGITQKGPLNEPVRISNWDEFCQYIAANNYFHLIQRRPGSKACQELWSQGTAIPGVDKFSQHKVQVKGV